MSSSDTAASNELAAVRDSAYHICAYPSDTASGTILRGTGEGADYNFKFAPVITTACPRLFDRLAVKLKG